MKIKAVFIALLIVTFIGCTKSAKAFGWTSPGEVEVVYAHKSHGGYGVFTLSSSIYNPNECPNPNYYVVSKQNNPMFDEIYSLLLAAHMSDKKVQVWLSGCSPHNHPEIHHARTVN